MQAYYPSSAAHSHAVIPTVLAAGMQAYHPSTTAHSSTVPTSMQAYYPSTAAHTHLNISFIPTADTPPASPTAADLIASLQNPENLSDEDLLKHTLNAQAALVKWQNEYLDNDREIRRATTGLFNKRNEPKALQLQDPKEYERSRDKAAQEATTTQETSSRGRKLTKTINAMPSQPARQAVPKTRKPKTTAPKNPQPPKVAAATSSKPKTTIPKGPQVPKIPALTSSKPKTTNPKGPQVPTIPALTSSKPKTTNSKDPQPPKVEASSSSKPKTTAPKVPQAPKPTTATSSKPKAPRPTRSHPPKPTTSIPPNAENQPLSIPKDLLIDMNGPQPAQTTGKRTRQPRKIFDSAPAPAPAPKAPVSRSATPSVATKKAPAPKAPVSRSATPSIATRKAPAPKAPVSRSATPSVATRKRARTVDVVDEDVAQPANKRRGEKETSVGAGRSKGDVMREVWARRQAEGRNGRNGGAPKVATVAKARAKEGGGK